MLTGMIRWFAHRHDFRPGEEGVTDVFGERYRTNTERCQCGAERASKARLPQTDLLLDWNRPGSNAATPAFKRNPS